MEAILKIWNIVHSFGIAGKQGQEYVTYKKNHVEYNEQNKLMN